MLRPVKKMMISLLALVLLSTGALWRAPEAVAEQNNTDGRSAFGADTTLRVRVFVDANNNGVLGKNEKFLQGAGLTLFAEDGSIVSESVTDAEGEAFLYAPAGDYILRCYLPEDYGYAKKGEKDNLISNSRMEQNSDRMQEAKVTLVSGAANEFGIGAQMMATLSGIVWLDENSDGLWQAEEPGVPGIVITAEGLRNGLTYETVSGEDGRYEIRQIRNGTYNVHYQLPDGYVFTVKSSGPVKQRSILTTEADRVGTDQMVFENGQVVSEQNVGVVLESPVEGVCFLDANYNGLWDEGEEVLSGVQVELFRQSNNKRLRTTVSDENGVYRFGNIRQDTFKLKVLLPTGYVYTMDVPGNADANQIPPKDGKREQTLLGVEAVNGESTRVLVGAISYGSITGVVYMDDNFSGKWESGESLASGLMVTLVDESGNAVKSAKTNKSGVYTFTELTPGEYRISMTAPDGNAFTTLGEGNVIRNAGGGSGSSDLLSVSLGEDVAGCDVGLIVPARVDGLVFADANDNGRYDQREKGLKGTVVTLTGEDGPVASDEVGADGSFLFDSVLPGRYYLRYELPGSAVFSQKTAGGSQVVGQGSEGAGDWFEVSIGESWTAPVCGGLELGSISGMAFSDEDGSGLMDEGEQPLPGVRIILTPSRDDLDEIQIITGADGVFHLDNLRPDTYTLYVRCPGDSVLSRMPDVTLGLERGLNEQTITLQVGMGDHWSGQNLGCVEPAAYTGEAWLDENLNGLREAEERPAVGETIRFLEESTGDVAAEVATDEAGRFRVEGLAPGSYTIAFTLDQGVAASASGDSTFHRDGGQLVMENVVIEEGVDASGALLGLVRETTLQGRVWLDNDGIIEPVAKARVILHQDGEPVAEAITGANGVYTFDGLMPGEYEISAALPEGCLALEPGDRRITSGENISILAENEGNTGRSGAFTLRMAEHQLQMDVGSVKPGRLGDYCWLDLNGNGLQDGDEGGIPGVEITLMRGGVAVASTVSSSYGYYVFTGLYPGEYTLKAVYPEEVRPTVVRTDVHQIVSVLNENGESLSIPVDSDGANYTADLGFVLVNEKKLPAGYGEAPTQDWSK